VIGYDLRFASSHVHAFLTVVEQTKRIEALEAVVGKQEATITELLQRCGADLTSTNDPNGKANHETGLLKRFLAAISSSK